MTTEDSDAIEKLSHKGVKDVVQRHTHNPPPICWLRSRFFPTLPAVQEINHAFVGHQDTFGLPCGSRSEDYICQIFRCGRGGVESGRVWFCNKVSPLIQLEYTLRLHTL